MNRNLSVVIPAAGIGRKMRSHNIKSLININGRSIVDRQISTIKNVYPKAEIILVVGYEADKVIEQLPTFVKVVENEEYEKTNIVRSIEMGLRVISNKHALVIHGDIVFNEAAIRGILWDHSFVFIDTQRQIGDYEIGLTIVDEKVGSFNYGIVDKKWSQMVFLTSKELTNFKNLAKDNRRHSTFEVLNKMIEKGTTFKAVEPKNSKIIEIDSSRDIEKAKKW